MRALAQLYGLMAVAMAILLSSADVHIEDGEQKEWTRAKISCVVFWPVCFLVVLDGPHQETDHAE